MHVYNALIPHTARFGDKQSIQTKHWHKDLGDKKSRAGENHTQTKKIREFKIHPYSPFRDFMRNTEKSTTTIYIVNGLKRPTLYTYTSSYLLYMKLDIEETWGTSCHWEVDTH